MEDSPNYPHNVRNSLTFWDLFNQNFASPTTEFSGTSPMSNDNTKSKGEPNIVSIDGNGTPIDTISNFEQLQITQDHNRINNTTEQMIIHHEIRYKEHQHNMYTVQTHPEYPLNLNMQLQASSMSAQNQSTQTSPNEYNEREDDDAMIQCEDDENFEYNDELNFLIDRFDLKEKKPNFMPYIY
jgi:hypothetical protein